MPLSFVSGMLGNVFNAISTRDTNRSNRKQQEAANTANLAIQREINESNRLINESTNLYNIQAVRETNQANIGMVRDTNAQNLALQHEAWRREDNATQRRVADLQAAGINPILAAGGAAQSSGPIKLDAPQAEAPQKMSYQERAVVMQAARMQRIQIETDLIERAMRMRDDFATNAASRRVMSSVADEHKARADQIRQDTRYGSESFDLRLDQTRQTIREQGERIALLELQQEHSRLSNIGQERQNHAIALENVRREVEAVVREERLKGEVTKLQEEIVSLQVANELAQHESDIYQGLGTTRSGSLIEKGYQHLRNLIRRGLDSAVETFTPFRREGFRMVPR